MNKSLNKPLGFKAYGSIGHLPQSRMGPGDHSLNIGQAKICTTKARDKHDRIIVQEKVDGSNVSVARVDGEIMALQRKGYLAVSSNFQQHQLFHVWAWDNRDRFLSVLRDGERLCGEWLAQAHGTRYDLTGREPFVAFDLMEGMKRVPFDEFRQRVASVFSIPHLLNDGQPIEVVAAMEKLGRFGFYGALDHVEGIVYRTERKGVVDFLAKYVRPDKVDGCYLIETLPDGTKRQLPPLWNWYPKTTPY